ncbi:MAG: NAD(P)-dependent oxidoreductase [Candidatus Nanopelagicales bacterium]|nr:NAD(P)-dependent oxidoreductase [Candidatus Nanopelagicales bacterium]
MGTTEVERQKLVVIGARSNLTHAIANHSNATVISSSEMLNPDTSISVPKNLPVIVNAFQPANHLSDLSDPVKYLDQSLGILARTLEWAESSQCSRLIYTSSAVVYGDNANCKEDDAVQINGIHGALKVAAEQLVSSFAQQFGIDFTIVRLFNLFGGEDRFSVIYRLEQAARSSSPFRVINAGESLRDFTHVTDAANLYLQLITGGNPGIINIGRGRGVCVTELIDVLRSKEIDLELEQVTRDEVQACVANTERLAQFADVENFRDPLTYLSNQVQS